jgi:hypothetical protein
MRWLLGGLRSESFLPGKEPSLYDLLWPKSVDTALRSLNKSYTFGHFLTSQKIESRAHGANLRARLYGVPGQLEQADLDALLLNSRGICFWCEQQSDPRFLVLDHVVPMRKGGPNTLSNLRPSCRHCNELKRDLDPVEFISQNLLRTVEIEEIRRSVLGEASLDSDAYLNGTLLESLLGGAEVHARVFAVRRGKMFFISDSRWDEARHEFMTSLNLEEHYYQRWDRLLFRGGWYLSKEQYNLIREEFLLPPSRTEYVVPLPDQPGKSFINTKPWLEDVREYPEFTNLKFVQSYSKRFKSS